jgi:hypothetical protein
MLVTELHLDLSLAVKVLTETVWTQALRWTSLEVTGSKLLVIDYVYSQIGKDDDSAFMLIKSDQIIVFPLLQTEVDSLA